MVSGGEGNDRVYGGTGNDTLSGGTGTGDYLSGDAGSDTYLFAKGDGNTTIYNYETDALAQDILRLDDIEVDDLWFSRSGNHLSIGLIGEGESLTVSHWYSGDKYQLDAIETSDGSVTAAQVDQLVHAMAVFDVPMGAGSVLTQEQDEVMELMMTEVWKIQ